MKTFEETFGNFVVTFNNSNEYIEVGSLDENPEFSGILIRKKFSTERVELFISDIKFFFEELSKIDSFDKEEPLVKLIHKYGWNKFSSDFVIVISDYDGIKCKFFTEISHQYNTVFDLIHTYSPEFSLQIIKDILKRALSVIEEK
jgi:hypothetical protein